MEIQSVSNRVWRTKATKVQMCYLASSMHSGIGATSSLDVNDFTTELRNGLL
jgi:hypothetical protein